MMVALSAYAAGKVSDGCCSWLHSAAAPVIFHHEHGAS
jgi:hypothetical protein